MALDLKHIEKKKKEKVKSDKSKEINLDFLNKDIKLFSKKFSDQKKESFYSELYILLSSGIDIKSSFEIIISQQKKEEDKKVFTTLYDGIIEGKSLSDAMEETDKFTPYEYFSLKIGEESGKIIDVLKELTTYFNKKIKQRRQLVGALTYPIIVLVTAILAVFFMMRFIVPMFVDVFKRFQGELPALTKKIIDISNFITQSTGEMFTILIVLVIMYFIFRKKEAYRKYSTNIMLRLPLFGEIIRKVYITKFCQAMALLMSSKTPMLKSMQLIKEMIAFYPFEQAIEGIRKDILYGKALHECMNEYSLFDKRMIYLTKVAEEVNQLDRIFEQLNIQYTEELEHRVSMISNLLEPILIIGVGLLVALILISMYLPLFQLSTSFF